MALDPTDSSRGWGSTNRPIRPSGGRGHGSARTLLQRVEEGESNLGCLPGGLLFQWHLTSSTEEDAGGGLWPISGARWRWGALLWRGSSGAGALRSVSEFGTKAREGVIPRLLAKNSAISALRGDPQSQDWWTAPVLRWACEGCWRLGESFAGNGTLWITLPSSGSTSQGAIYRGEPGSGFSR